jgi:hypothetical protein
MNVAWTQSEIARACHLRALEWRALPAVGAIEFEFAKQAGLIEKEERCEAHRDNPGGTT